MKKQKWYKHQPIVDALNRFVDVIDAYRKNCQRIEIVLVKRFFYERLDFTIEFREVVNEEEIETKGSMPVVLPPDPFFNHGDLPDL